VLQQGAKHLTVARQRPGRQWNMSIRKLKGAIQFAEESRRADIRLPAAVT
jgi:hypothetical protein